MSWSLNVVLSGIVIISYLLNERIFKIFSPKFNTSKVAEFLFFFSTPVVKCQEFLDFVYLLI